MPENSIPLLSYHEFGAQLAQVGYGQRIPLSGEIELTHRCNQNCGHCFVNLPSGDRKAKQKELTFEEVCRILDEITEAGCLYLLLTGGEPMLRPDFLDIYTYAKRKGLLVTIFCTGTLITPRIAEYLVEWPPFKIEITLYGATEETYERVTGLPGSYRKCLKGIRLLTERRLPLKLKTILMALNKHEFAAIEKFGANLGLKLGWDPHINPRIDGGRKPVYMRVDPEEVVKIDMANGERVTEWHAFCDRLPNTYRTDKLYACGAGLTMFHIDPYGQMTPCTMTRLHKYDLRQGRFRGGWNGMFADLRKLRRPVADRCADCDLTRMCLQCTGYAQLEHGVEWAPVDYLCELTHLRAKALGIQHERRICCDDLERVKSKRRFALPISNRQAGVRVSWNV